MNRLALAPVLGLALVGCAHSQAPSRPLQTAEARCQLVQTLAREPVVDQRLSEMVNEGQELPVPLTVFVRNPEEGQLERLFEDDVPQCGGEQFRVVRQLAREGLVIYLHESPDGFAFDARRAGPDDLTMAGSPQGFVRRSTEGGWVASSSD